jgi:hypothetical protein
MKASRAYITGLGTTGVLLCFALLLLAVVSAIVTFRGWPAGAAGDDSTAVSIGSDRGSRAVPLRREVTAPRRAEKAGARKSATRAKRSRSRDRLSVNGVSQSGGRAPAHAPGAAPGQSAAPEQSAAPGGPAAPSAPAAGAPIPQVAPEAPQAPDVGQVSTGVADTTQQVSEEASGAVDDLAPAPLGQTVSDTGQAVSDLVEQTGDTTQQQLPQLP